MEREDAKIIKIELFTLKNIIVVVIIALAVLFCYQKYKNYVNNEKIKAITATLKESSDLITQRLIYSGIYVYKAGVAIRIPYITERSHKLKYEANLSAGIDLEKDFDYEVKNDSIVFKLKHAYVIDKYLIPESLEVYDVKGSLIYYDKEQDILDSQKEVSNNLDKILENDEKANITIDQLIEKADAKVKELIIELYKDLLVDKKLEFKYIDGGEQ